MERQTLRHASPAIEAAPAIISVTPVTDLVSLGVQPGWFVKLGDCSIWFEVSRVWPSMIECAARDPHVATSLGMVGNFFSAIDAVSPVAPPYSRWIKLNRNKNFFDKFYPERGSIVHEA